MVPSMLSMRRAIGKSLLWLKAGCHYPRKPFFPIVHQCQKPLIAQKNLVLAKQSNCNYLFELTLRAKQSLTIWGSTLTTTDAERAKKPKLPKKKLLERTHQNKGRWQRSWKARKRTLSKNCITASFALNVARRRFFGRKDFLNSGLDIFWSGV